MGTMLDPYNQPNAAHVLNSTRQWGHQTWEGLREVRVIRESFLENVHLPFFINMCFAES